MPNILDALKSEINNETYSKLNDFQNMVIKSLNKNKSSDDLIVIIPELVEEIKNIGLNAKSSEKK